MIFLPTVFPELLLRLENLPLDLCVLCELVHHGDALLVGTELLDLVQEAKFNAAHAHSQRGQLEQSSSFNCNEEILFSLPTFVTIAGHIS